MLTNAELIQVAQKLIDTWGEEAKAYKVRTDALLTYLGELDKLLVSKEQLPQTGAEDDGDNEQRSDIATSDTDSEEEAAENTP
jgi:hypothetical protein